MLKRGTRIETHGGDYGAFVVTPEQAVIIGKAWGIEGRPEAGVWYPVRFDNDGRRICLHTTHFRVVDNRA